MGKGYDGTGWDDVAESVTFTRYKFKNGKSSKKREYSFECQEAPWSKMSDMRRIIVKATNHAGNMITVSVLCSNPLMPIEEVVWLIFNRWLQENDFKYLGKHFGINQLDSRSREKFKDKMNEFKDRLKESSEYKKIRKEVKTATNALAKNLLKQNRKKKDAENKQMEIDKINASLIIIQKGKLNNKLKKELKKQKIA